MNNEISFVILTFIIVVQIQFLIAENHCSKSVVMNIIMEQCSRQRRNARNYFNNHYEIGFNSNSVLQNGHHRNRRRRWRKNIMTKSRVGRFLLQVSEDYEGLPNASLSDDDMDEILEFVRRTPRSYRNKDEIIRNVAICCQDIESCRKNKSIITCP